ncbi:hypothetical protein [Cellulomonas endophytica]|uniref:hypothetical protein n=1 Tax=Cellulomonas endophytica TaxID=2494735 RepID=UPI001012F23B|nr:hypothetical protein [Cellulomonas endophytica]
MSETMGTGGSPEADEADRLDQGREQDGSPAGGPGDLPDAEDRPALPEAGADDLPDALPDGAAEADALEQALPAGGDGEDEHPRA